MSEEFESLSPADEAQEGLSISARYSNGHSSSEKDEAALKQAIIESVKMEIESDHAVTSTLYSRLPIYSTLLTYRSDPKPSRARDPMYKQRPDVQKSPTSTKAIETSFIPDKEDSIGSRSPLQKSHPDISTSSVMHRVRSKVSGRSPSETLESYSTDYSVEAIQSESIQQ
jgi:hypothetical protein